MAKETCAEYLADFVSGLRFEDIPPEVIDNAKRRLLDTVGIGLACSRMQYAEKLVETVVEQGGKQEATIIGFGYRLPAPGAILVNASLAHGIDFDDTHIAAGVHPSSCIFPTALAVGELVSAADGKTVLTAAIAGLETMVRLGLAATVGFHAKGFQPTSVCGPVAASVVSGKILGLGPGELVSAMGIGGTLAFGCTEFLSLGSSVKKILPGWAGQSGVMAALLAQKGFAGPATILEGSHGLYQTHLGEGNYNLEVLTRGLGETWESQAIAYKSYPCCHVIQSYVDCVLQMRQKYAIPPDEVSEMQVKVGGAVGKRLCEPIEGKAAPPTPYEAQFSIPYTVAVALIDGQVGISQYRDEKIRDGKIHGLAGKVRPVADPAFEVPGKLPGWVKIKMKDGREYECGKDYPWGSPEDPFTDEDIENKFMANATLAVPKEKARKILDAVYKFENTNNMKEFMGLLKWRGQ